MGSGAVERRLPYPSTKNSRSGMSPYIRNLITIFAIVKGLLIASVTLVIGVTFFQSLVIAIVSSSIGAVGASLAAYIAIRGARENKEILHDIKRNTQTAKREGDIPEYFPPDHNG